jgi:hypothetical protein
MPVKEADPGARSLDAAFAEAMGAPAKPKEPGAPPEIDPEAPHGRDDAGAPLVPYGRTRDGKVRKSAAGRKSKDEEPRTGPAQPDEPKTGTVVAEPKDYSGALSETGDSVWLALTVLGQLPLEKIPLISRIPIGKGVTLGSRLAGAEVRLQAQAAILDGNKAQLVAALNIAAQNNARARRLAEKLETGDITWVMMCGAMAAPFLVQTRQLWSDPAVDVQALARSNEETFRAWVQQITDAITAAAEQQNGQLPTAPPEAP